MIRVTIWNEFYHEKIDEAAKKQYPEGIHSYLKNVLEDENILICTATLDMQECGLNDEVLNNTDVLIWWGHMLHDNVPDEIVLRVHERVLNGMGFIALHSSHHSKMFKRLMGTNCHLKWREGDRERVWTVKPNHPIANGVPEYFELDPEEMYGESFDIPNPDDVVFMGWFKGGEVFRSGCTFTRSNGKIFYFQPGHEAYPTYKNATVQKIIKNAIIWCNPIKIVDKINCPCVKSLECE